MNIFSCNQILSFTLYNYNSSIVHSTCFHTYSVYIYHTQVEELRDLCSTLQIDNEIKYVPLKFMSISIIAMENVS